MRSGVSGPPIRWKSPVNGKITISGKILRCMPEDGPKINWRIQKVFPSPILLLRQGVLTYQDPEDLIKSEDGGALTTNVSIGEEIELNFWVLDSNPYIADYACVDLIITTPDTLDKTNVACYHPSAWDV